LQRQVDEERDEEPDQPREVQQQEAELKELPDPGRVAVGLGEQKARSCGGRPLTRKALRLGDQLLRGAGVRAALLGGGAALRAGWFWGRHARHLAALGS
jgi:hypothetical protein